MTTRLARTLREVAEAAPPVPVPPLLFEKARRTRRHRRVAGLAAALAALALVAVPLAGYDPPTRPAQGADDGLPTRVVWAPYHATLLQQSPVGTAVAVFGNGDDDDSVLTVVGPRDLYRAYHRPEWTAASDVSPSFLLSPDGRYLLMANWILGQVFDNGSWILDLTTGQLSTVDTGLPLAWAPTGGQAIFVKFSDHPGGPSWVKAEVRVADPATRRVTWRVTLPYRANAMTGLTAAMSPDGESLAIEQGTDLMLFRHTGPVWHVPLGTDRLAGPGAWTPDGRFLATADPHGHLTLRDAATGNPGTATLPVPLPEPSAALIGWRGGDPVAVTRTRVELLTAPPTVLMTAPDDDAELQIATDALTRPAHLPGPPDAGPFLRRWLVLEIPATVVVVLVAAIVLVRRHRRRRRDREWLEVWYRAHPEHRPPVRG